MCANLSGSPASSLLNLSGIRRKSVPGRAAVVYHDALYVLLSEVRRVQEEDLDRAACLCRLHPDQKDPIEVIRKLPATCSTFSFQFDQDYLYYISKEKHVGP